MGGAALDGRIHPLCTPAHAPTAKSGAETPQRVSGMARAPYRPFDDSVPWWLRVDVRERTRHTVCTRKVNESFRHTAHSRSNNRTTTIYSQQQQQTGPTAVAAARSSSEPPIVRSMTHCLRGCALLGSVMCALCYLVIYLLCSAWVDLLRSGCMLLRVFCYYKKKTYVL